MIDIPPEPRPSATVVVVRQGETKPEIFMVKRNLSSAFAAAYAFPGGVLESCDRLVYEHCLNLPAEQANRTLRLTSDGLEYFSAAIREVFEETGILLATADFSCDLEEVRDQLNSGQLAWSKAVGDYGFTMHCDQLHYFAHWVTPLSEPRRFSTRFFLAVLPEGQVATHDGQELTDSCWMTASDVLQSARAGDMQLIYPTYSTLKEIRNLNSTNDIVSWAKSHTQSGIDEVLPAIIDSGSGKTVVLPGDARYPEKGGQ